jgi:hypothetical protein
VVLWSVLVCGLEHTLLNFLLFDFAGHPLPETNGLTRKKRRSCGVHHPLLLAIV